MLIVILKLPFLRIKNVEVEGVVALSGEELKEKADLNLAGKYLHIIPKTSSIFYPKEKIRKDILESFRKIKTLDIELKGLSTLKISVTEREPEIIVCEGFKEASNSDECFFADEGGYVYESTSTAIDDVYFKYYMNSGSTTVATGQKFIETEKFNEFQKFVQNIKRNGIEPTGMLVAEDGNHELYIKNVDDSLAVVYFDERTPFDKIASNLITFWQNAMIEMRVEDVVPTFDYINLRFGNNVFYITR